MKVLNLRLPPLIDYVGNKARLKSNKSCLKQDQITYNHGKIVNIYIAYELSFAESNKSYPKQENSLFGAVKLTKNTDIDTCKYSGYSIGLDTRGTFSVPGGGFGQKIIA